MNLGRQQMLQFQEVRQEDIEKQFSEVATKEKDNSADEVIQRKKCVDVKRG